jgi:NAD(P)H-hydrate epimerase
MFVPLPETDGALVDEALQASMKAVARADAVVLGPGVGRTPDAQLLVRELVERIDVPLVIDADGLNALAGHLGDLRHRRWPTVLTPHAGELGRLLEVESSEIERARLAHARDAAARSRALVVLKGDDTLIAGPSGQVAVSRGNAPALATAGTGDVLAGVTGALLARRLPPAHAVAAAVYAHARAGQLAAAPHGPDGVIASDVIAALPAALAA